ncbi:HIT domain-containing protein [Sphingomonas mesophila]|uniref:HIT domain-containing protein n=1 Tax=Sphingomonas mesophila TaxID=2303576 RepID=UPI000E583016|nr:HIT domain-containing protein [Sphingomonas mesophila]
MPIDHKLPYDEGNVFARIVSGELPSQKVVESKHSIAIHDINPLAPVHLLIVPRGKYVSWDDFSANASDAEIADLVRTAGDAARATGADAKGYRLIANVGQRGGQEFGHLHLHLLGGEPLGPMLAR